MVNAADISDKSNTLISLPWLTSHEDYIKKLISLNKLSRVTLLYGPQGSGKSLLASNIAKIINKNLSSIISFGTDQEKITMDDIREIIDCSHRTATLDNYNIFIINNCENLATGAANGLLKTLEEENHNNFFILTSSNLNKVLPTILSRCFKIVVTAKAEIACQWLSSNGVSDKSDQACLLELAGFGPLKALQDYSNGYLDKIKKTTNILTSLTNINVITLHKQAIELFTIKENKKNIIDVTNFINIINYLLTRNFINSSGSSGFSKATFELIKKYKNHLDNNIAIDASNVIYNILYALQMADVDSKVRL